MRGIQIVTAKLTQLLPPKCPIIGERHHAAVAYGLACCGLKERGPLLLGRDPRESAKAREQTSLGAGTEMPGDGITAATDGVARGDLLLDEKLKEQSHGG